MAAKLILTALIASLKVNGSPCKPNSSPSISLVFTSSAAFTTTTIDSSAELGLSTQSSIFDSTLYSTSKTLETSSSETFASETTRDGSSDSTVPASFTTTNSIVEESTTVESAVVTSLSSDPATTSSIASTTTTAEPQTPIGFYNGGFEDDSTSDARPWVIGRSVTIENDPANAHSGDRYALVKYPITGTGRPIDPLRQTISGLDPKKKYLLTFYWAFTEFYSLSNTGCDFWTYFGPAIELYKFKADGMPTNEYFKRQYLVTLVSITDKVDLVFYWRCSNSAPASPWAGAEIRVDDVSLVEYDPPCALIKPPPEDLVCGQIGSFPSSANSFLIGSEVLLGPFENCAQLCAENPECKTVAGVFGSGDVIGHNARCKLYSAMPEDLGFYTTTTGSGVFQPGCFECRPSK
ncbi:unnamed protein product [Fusarium graminearum]|nr:unnamed protein product [Fusarium graminearum]